MVKGIEVRKQVENPEMDEREKRLKRRKRTHLIWLPTTV